MVGITIMVVGVLLMLSGVGAIAGIPAMMICIAGRNFFFGGEKK